MSEVNKVTVNSNSGIRQYGGSDEPQTTSLNLRDITQSLYHTDEPQTTSLNLRDITQSLEHTDEPQTACLNLRDITKSLDDTELPDFISEPHGDTQLHDPFFQPH